MIDEAKPLTGEEEAEKRILLTQGFTSWSKIDFNQFVNANFKFGRLDVAKISSMVKGINFKTSFYVPNCNLYLSTGKTEDEIREYSAVFWERYREIQNIDHILNQGKFNRLVRIDPKYQAEVLDNMSRL